MHMGIKKSKVEKCNSMEDIFPGLYRYSTKYQEIHWEYLDDEYIKTSFSGDCLRINKVGDFTNSGSLRKYINDLYIDDFILFRKLIKKEKKHVQVCIIEHLLAEAEDLKLSTIGEYPVEGKEYKAFSMWVLAQDNKKTIEEINIPEAHILRLAEPYPLSFLKGMDEFIWKLHHTKTEIEFNVNEDNDPLTFEHMLWDTDSAKLNDLFDTLCLAGFLSLTSNDVVDFKRIFSGKKVRKKLVWYKDNQDLYWFITCLKDNELLKNPGSCWKKACNCFDKKGNIPFEIQELSKSHKPSCADEINNLVTDKLKLGNSKK
jgi:hypothetical protein